MGKVVAHGVVGGVRSELSGGDFASGFASGAFTQAASLSGVFENLGDPATLGGRLASVSASATLGGTASVLGGGKFANGAKTSGFLQLLGEVANYATRATDGLSD